MGAYINWTLQNLISFLSEKFVAKFSDLFLNFEVSLNFEVLWKNFKSFCRLFLTGGWGKSPTSQKFAQQPPGNIPHQIFIPPAKVHFPHQITIFMLSPNKKFNIQYLENAVFGFEISLMVKITHFQFLIFQFSIFYSPTEKEVSLYPSTLFGKPCTNVQFLTKNDNSSLSIWGNVPTHHTVHGNFLIISQMVLRPNINFLISIQNKTPYIEGSSSR